MTTFTGFSGLLKDGIVGVDPANPLASVIIFQYNPDTITHWLEAYAIGCNGVERPIVLERVLGERI